VTSVDPDQLAHLIWIYTRRILVRNNLMNQNANSLDPNQTAQTVRNRNKGVSMQEMVNLISVG
jgi:hypothetical protein